ncbi:MGH1-like glycoside hydrolase domain-containing protein [Rhizobium leguminosarum]|uniref:MGH1-like glycoside hydrolase domain-containing protein n=1 Tax=Rhizobium TaxID=379 RepID=UPI0010301B44|nr:glucosidase [Rhizobium leguminosarum]MBY5388431.1 glucosidase [Rhizobium leguminosarum]MBY5430221.1 glucosidase [Rhizobium leguminosarum]NEK46778.1 glucosidase [Rhizobium leguminosarum]TBG87048.1 glucosidase [Rhizobium leguminosarum]
MDKKLASARTGAETKRLAEARDRGINWKKWGPYLSERQWGTVREDYSETGDAWNFFTHDHARSRAYRWGEDGIAGISNDKQNLCFALALWNGKDPILKERLFGLTNNEGNHGEDVKEYYFYIDSTPTHSYMKYLYKYPQAVFPYADLVETNGRRSRNEFEYELLDTGVFDDDRYFDVFVEYAKAAPEDILVKITAFNRGPDAANLHLLPTLWFRNDWASWIAETSRAARKPNLRQIEAAAGQSTVAATDSVGGAFLLSCEGDVPLLFTENETNAERLFPGQRNESLYVKDGINNFVVQGDQNAVNPERQGTKVAAHYRMTIAPGQSATVRLRLSAAKTAQARTAQNGFGKEFDQTLAERLQEADEFYSSLTPSSVSPDAANVMRQAIAGMLWSKQFYFFDGDNWLDEHHSNPLHAGYRHTRNSDWFHMLNEDVISMPDKWEYPWYAAWDLAFHTLPIAIVDPDFAKDQLKLMLRGVYLHPNGQMPAYEWNFGDVNPPVHAFATLFLHRTEQALRGETDVQFLREAFNKLVLNFTWWVNRKDRFGKNVFEGGFLGLDNIGIFDRSAPLPTGGHLEQADGTAWMALFSQNMMELAVELAVHDPTYEDMVVKFAEHFYYIAGAMNQPDKGGMWDEEDGFYYDLLRLPDGSGTRLKVRSMVGLLPLCAATVMEPWQRERIPRAMEQLAQRMRRMPELQQNIHVTGPGHYGVSDRGMFALVNSERLRRILSRMLDENEFLSSYGIRSLSKAHERDPYVFQVQGQEYRVDYLPSESNTGMFGGNSNWRGPVWMPVNVLIIRALQNFYLYYGDNFKIECPTGSGKLMNLFEVSKEIADRLGRIFLRDEHGRRAVYGGTEKFQTDPHWRDLVLFYEYFHGDNGAGLGASHQTGWTGLIAKTIQLYGLLDPQKALEVGKQAAFTQNPK